MFYAASGPAYDTVDLDSRLGGHRFQVALVVDTGETRCHSCMFSASVPDERRLEPRGRT